MFKDAPAFSSFSVDDLEKAKAFYGETLGLEVAENPYMGLTINLAGGMKIYVYPKEDHQPATFTVLNFSVEDIDKAVDELKTRGVVFEQYEGEMQTDEKGIARSGSKEMPDIAWFRDPAGNFLSVSNGTL
ncbi:catechol 2,3-dioxygenase-like lactoylglutathione lyase family enzyme [Methanohalophilus levihalophilus]|uniref:VOC family protein n=1 Tax=Methanohalophilus levihalophilus TaxID=1431282 RepID=UPI001AE41428|nr:catechol 2,3-dioxygenase-like lactoylglutathione lyase family enzyme [Methanohalophilus levihalophilus]